MGKGCQAADSKRLATKLRYTVSIYLRIIRCWFWCWYCIPGTIFEHGLIRQDMLNWRWKWCVNVERGGGIGDTQNCMTICLVQPTRPFLLLKRKRNMRTKSNNNNNNNNKDIYLTNQSIKRHKTTIYMKFCPTIYLLPTLLTSPSPLQTTIDIANTNCGDLSSPDTPQSSVSLPSLRLWRIPEPLL